MYQYEYSIEKNNSLKETRGISFEEVIAAIEEGYLLAVIEHWNKDKYPNQEVLVIDISGYVHYVPFVRKDKNTIFLKTIVPNRKMNKEYK